MKLENERYVVTFTTKGGEIESFTDKETWNPVYVAGKS